MITRLKLKSTSGSGIGNFARHSRNVSPFFDTFFPFAVGFVTYYLSIWTIRSLVQRVCLYINPVKITIVLTATGREFTHLLNRIPVVKTRHPCAENINPFVYPTKLEIVYRCNIIPRNRIVYFVLEFFSRLYKALHSTLYNLAETSYKVPVNESIIK